MTSEVVKQDIARARPLWQIFAILIVAATLPALPFVIPINSYVLNIFMQAVTYGIAVMGMTIVLGYTGQINLAQAAFFGLGAYAVAIGTVAFGLGFWAALVLGVGIACVAGLILGLTTLRLGGHYLAMITISFQQIFDLVMVNWTSVTKGPDGISGIVRPTILGYQLTDDRSFLLLCAIILYAAGALVWYLPKTRLGRAMRAVKENELAAEVIGVNTFIVKVAAFVICAGFAGVGGALYATGFAYVSPDNFTFKVSIEFLTMALLGGAQSPFGSVIGTMLLILMPEWLRFLKEIYLAVYGIAVILIMVFMPEGIWGLVKMAWYKLFRPRVSVWAASLPLNLKVTAGSASALRLEGVCKHFGGVRAVDGIDISVLKGTVHALIGPNGSGKTTTLNVLSGIYKPTSGRILVDEHDVTRDAPHLRSARGLGRTFQNIRLFPTMSTLENVMVGAQRKNNPIGQGTAALQQRALSALEFVGLIAVANVAVKNLPYGHQRLVEVARALAGRPSVLLLDEPAAGLNQTEKRELAELLSRLRGHGLTIFLIEHDMDLILQISDRITVLNFGRKIAEGTPAEVLRHPAVIEAYLGENALALS